MDAPESERLFQRMKEGAIEICQMSGEGALHIFVEDGNCEDDHLEFCLEQPNITNNERAFVQSMLSDFTDQQRHGVWAFAQCSDIIAEAMGIGEASSAD